MQGACRKIQVLRLLRAQDERGGSGRCGVSTGSGSRELKEKSVLSF